MRVSRPELPELAGDRAASETSIQAQHHQSALFHFESSTGAMIAVFPFGNVHRALVKSFCTAHFFAANPTQDGNGD